MRRPLPARCGCTARVCRHRRVCRRRHRRRRCGSELVACPRIVAAAAAQALRRLEERAVAHERPLAAARHVAVGVLALAARRRGVWPHLDAQLALQVDARRHLERGLRVVPRLDRRAREGGALGRQAFVALVRRQLEHPRVAVARAEGGPLFGGRRVDAKRDGVAVEAHALRR
eukprot:945072-Prymnesium_polylepis.2